MADIKIIHESTVAHSKAFLFLLEEYVKLVKLGFADNELAFSNSSNCTYALRDDLVIGASAWFIDHSKRSAGVLFSAVSENHRRQGVYQAMITAIEQNAKAKGVVAFYSGVHVDNEPMIAAAKLTGRSLSWYRGKKLL